MNSPINNDKSGGLAKFLKTVTVAPTEADKKAASEAFKKSMGERAKLEKALADFDKKSTTIAENMVRAFGTKQVTVDGVRFAPTSRGDRIYYKTMSSTTETVEL